MLTHPWRHTPIVALCCAVAITLVTGTAAADAQTAEPPNDRASVYGHPSGSRIWLSGQLNLISQFHGAFSSPYEGPNSFRAAPEQALSRVWTLYTGVKVGSRMELLADIESAGGHGLSSALGLAGFTNLDVVRNPSLGPAPYAARALAHWTIPLTGDEEPVTPTALSLAPRLPANRIDVRAGKLSLVDSFDVNTVLSDSHLQFTNWTVANNGAYDYAADTHGYTVGVTVDYERTRWTLRGGEALMPTVANGPRLDWNVRRAHADNIELELRPTSRFTARVLGYANHADMGSYQEAIDQFHAHLVPVPDIVAVRKQRRIKTGAGLNVEYAFPRIVRLAARLGWNEGHNESFAYTEVNGTVQGGGDVSGELWNRRHDRLGIAIVSNALSAAHREYLRLGGLGFLLGDGSLAYGRESLVEVYYTAQVWHGVSIAGGMQHVANPGYNTNRGPVSVGSVRLHVDF